MLVDRELELRELQPLLDEKTPQLALLYGRRRVGKTHLLTHTWPSERTFYWTASETTPLQNREQLIRDVSEWANEHFEPKDYPTWRTVFRLLGWRQLFLSDATSISFGSSPLLGGAPSVSLA